MKKRHYKVVKPIRFFIFILLVVFALTFASYGFLGNSSKAEASAATRYAEVVIQENDTLWNIASMYNPDYDGDIRDLVHDIYYINGITASDIHPGDKITIPVY